MGRSSRNNKAEGDNMKLPKLTGSPTARKEAHTARMRDMDYRYAIAAGLSVRGNWRKRARRERLYAEE